MSYCSKDKQHLRASGRVGNLSNKPFAVYQDFLPPAVTLHVTPTFTPFAVTWSITNPLLDGNVPGSGLAAYTVQVCPDSPTNCTNLVPNPGTAGTTTFQGAPDHPYTFRVWAKDRVDNETTAESGPYGTASVTKYYLFGGQRIAMRQGGAVYYLHGDHLGSTSLTTAVTGQLVSQARYTPFGGLHWESGAAPTDFGFTGQRAERGLGLLDYQARFYAAALGRFVSVDSIVPDQYNPSDWDHYTYTRNNPIKFNDPSGHSCDNPRLGEEDCSADDEPQPPIDTDGDGIPEEPDPDHEKITGMAGLDCAESTYVECFYARELFMIEDVMCLDYDQFLLLLLAIYYDLRNRDLTMADRQIYDTPFWNAYGRGPGTVCLDGGGCYERHEVNYIAQGMWSAAEGEPLWVGIAVVYAWKTKNHLENPETYPSYTPSDGTLYWFELGYNDSTAKTCTLTA